MSEKYKRPIKTQEKIDEIRKETNIKRALEGIVDLFENYVNFEEEIPVRYDPKTGKPVKFKLVPSADQGKFLSEIYLGGVNKTDPTPQEPGLTKSVVDRIKSTSPVSIDTRFGTYIFSYEERHDSDEMQGGGTCYSIKHSISVKKISKLE